MKSYTVKATKPDHGMRPYPHIVIAGQVQPVPPLLGAEAGDLIIHVPKAEANTFEWRFNTTSE